MKKHQSNFGYGRMGIIDLYAPGIKKFLDMEKTSDEIVKILARLMRKDNPQWKYKKYAKRIFNQAIKIL